MPRAPAAPKARWPATNHDCRAGSPTGSAHDAPSRSAPAAAHRPPEFPCRTCPRQQDRVDAMIPGMAGQGPKNRMARLSEAAWQVAREISEPLAEMQVARMQKAGHGHAAPGVVDVMVEDAAPSRHRAMASSSRVRDPAASRSTPSIRANSRAGSGSSSRAGCARTTAANSASGMSGMARRASSPLGAR